MVRIADKTRCAVSERMVNWPYVRKCKNKGVHQITNSLAEELDIFSEDYDNKVLICDIHKKILENHGFVVNTVH